MKKNDIGYSIHRIEKYHPSFLILTFFESAALTKKNPASSKPKTQDSSKIEFLKITVTN